MKLLILLSQCKVELGEFDSAISSFNKAHEFLNEFDRLPNLVVEKSRCELYLMGASLLEHGLDEKWLPKASTYLSKLIDIRPINSSFWSDIFWIAFCQFHFMWLRFGVKNASKNITTVLAIIQSRSLYFRLVESLSENENSSYFEGRKRIKKHFSECQKARNAYVNQYYSELYSHDYNTNISNQSDKNFGLSEHLKEKFRAQIIETSNDNFEKLASKIIDSNFTNHLKSLTVQSIADKLKLNECFVVLVDSTVVRATAKNYGISEEFINFPHYAIFFESSGEVKTIELDLNLLKLAAYVNKSGDHFNKGVVRKGAGESEIPFPCYDDMCWESISMDMRNQIWNPLIKAVGRQVNTFLVVTHGFFHTAPLEAGFPREEGFNYERYLSMLFIGKQRPQVKNESNRQGLFIRNSDETLLFASTEASTLLPNIWSGGKWKTDLNEGNLHEKIDGAKYQCLHLSGHGIHQFIEHRYCHDVQLATSNNQFINEDIIASHFREIEYVWLSACAIGLTSEDTQGDPTGLIVPFLLNGTKKVIASSTNVSDIWMPLLIAFTEWIFVRNDLTIDDSLDRAKQLLPDLANNNEYSEFTSIFKNWIESVIKEWFRGMWEVSEGEPWLSTEDGLFNQFLAQIMSEDFPDIGMFIPEDEILWITSDINLTKRQKIDYVINRFKLFAIAPSVEVCNTLKYTVNIYTANLKENLLT